MVFRTKSSLMSEAAHGIYGEVIYGEVKVASA